MLDENAQLMLEARSPDGAAYLNGYDMQASLVAPDGENMAVTLQQVAPGRYQGDFQPNQEGVYLIHVTGSPPDASQPPIAETTGWVLSYSPEYRQPGSNPDILMRLLTQNAGSSAMAQLTSGDPAEVFFRDFPMPKANQPIWPLLISLAACLLPLDIAARRLVITRQDLQLAWQRLSEQITRRSAQVRRGQAAPPTARSTQMEQLLRVKERRQGWESKKSSTAPATTSQSKTVDQSPPTQPEKSPSERGKPSSEPASGKVESPDSSTAAALLAKKRARQERRDHS